MRIDHYSLELFISVAEMGSITRAASLNRIAASALSRRLTDLEAVIGMPLLIRSAAGVEMTEAGRHALLFAKNVDEQFQQMTREIQTLSRQVAGVVRLFANASAIVGFLPEILKSFQASFPLVHIALVEQISDEVIRACLDGRADVGISANCDTSANLQTWHFAQDPLMVVLPPGHDLEKREILSFSDVIRFPVVALQAGGSLYQVLKDRADGAGSSLNLAVTVNSFDAQCRMVEAGLGIGLVPRSAASAFAGSHNFVRRPLDEEWARSRSLHVHTVRKTALLRPVQALIEFLTLQTHSS